jgi:lipid A ethanolaminephosphotransferase
MTNPAVWYGANTPGAIPATPGDNAGMALRLFRTTGYSTLMMPGETRLAMHPAWLVLAASVWIAVACNAGLWRLPAHPEDARTAFATAALLGGGAGVFLSLLGWRRTLKPAITIVLIVAALLACGLWVQQLPVESLWQQRPRGLMPPWASFMRWQVPALMLLLALVPIVWVWNVSVRRLPGPVQLRSNLLGALLAAAVLVAGLALRP